MEADSPDVVIAKQLLDHAKRDGFTFQLMQRRVEGSALDVLQDVLTWQPEP